MTPRPYSHDAPDVLEYVQARKESGSQLRRQPVEETSGRAVQAIGLTPGLTGGRDSGCAASKPYVV